MCARYTIASPYDQILEQYAFEMEHPYQPNYNLAPTQLGYVVTSEAPTIINQYHFGLVPHWAKDKKVAYSMLNARSETLMEKTSFKPLMEKNKRCLVLADGFYEWETAGKEKLPYRFILPDRQVFAFAGLYSMWFDKLNNAWYKTYTILTTEPNGLVSKLHDRMPVILDKQEETMWLSNDVPVNDLLAICDTFPDVEMDMYRVSKEVNKVINNHERLILPENSN